MHLRKENFVLNKNDYKTFRSIRSATVDDGSEPCSLLAMHTVRCDACFYLAPSMATTTSYEPMDACVPDWSSPRLLASL